MNSITTPSRPPIPARPREPLGNRPLPKGIVALDQKQPAPNAAAADRAPEGTLIVGRDIHVQGEIEDCRVLVVEGRVEAAIKAESLEIREGGRFEGTAEVARAQVAGSFEGTMRALERLSVAATGRVQGDIRYARIAIEAGGEIAGTVEAGAKAAEPDQAARAPSLASTGS